MTKKLLMALGMASLMAPVTGHAGDETPTCCRKSKAAKTAEATPQKLRCTLTNKVVDKCCCVERDGKQFCTLAKKDVKTCCCKPVDDKAAANHTGHTSH